MTASYDQRAAEQWFRRRGLPSIVRGHPVGLIVRIVPGVITFGLWELMSVLATYVDGDSDEEFERRFNHTWFQVLYIAVLVAVFVVPIVGAWLSARWVRRQLVDGRGRPIAVAVIAIVVFVVPIVLSVAPPHETYWPNIAIGLAIVALVFGLAYLGAGSIMGWALRAAFRQARLVGVLTGRALPLLLLFTIFGFLTTELWQVGATLSRARVWALVALFAIVTVLFLTTMLSDEVKALAESADQTIDPAQLDRTPFAAVVDSPLQPRAPLGTLERINMILVLVLTQAFQAAVLAALTFTFFIVFGAMAIKDSVIKTWIGRAPEPGQLFGLQVPVANEMLHVSLFIAAFSALYFAASTVTDANYRKAFLQPLTEHLATTLAARDLYLAQLSDT